MNGANTRVQGAPGTMNTLDLTITPMASSDCNWRQIKTAKKPAPTYLTPKKGKRSPSSKLSKKSRPKKRPTTKFNPPNVTKSPPRKNTYYPPRRVAELVGISRACRGSGRQGFR
eukprot:92889-Amorphochlora_amoeboformis.AAC.2